MIASLSPRIVRNSLKSAFLIMFAIGMYIVRAFGENPAFGSLKRYDSGAYASYEFMEYVDDMRKANAWPNMRLANLGVMAGVYAVHARKVGGNR